MAYYQDAVNNPHCLLRIPVNLPFAGNTNCKLETYETTSIATFQNMPFQLTIFIALQMNFATYIFSSYYG